MADAASAIRDEVKAIPPYNSGLTIDEVRRRYGVEVSAKLGSNENPHGPSPAVAAALSDLSTLARLYPDPGGRALCEAIAASLDVDAGQIILGNGSEDLIAVVCRAAVRPGDVVATLYPSFPLHEDYAVLMGGTVERVEVTTDLTVDIDALIEAARRKPRMLIFSNPMNPVGCWLTPANLSRLVEAVDETTLLVVDEAYVEYAAGDDYASALDLLRHSGLNWLILRTFSKAYGLAGFRIGYGIAANAELKGFLDRARTPFNTNAVAQAAAIAALGDAVHLRRCVEDAVAERARVIAALATLGYRTAPSRCNSVFFDTGANASEVAEALLARGVIVKPWKQPGYESFIRASIGAASENDSLIAALTAIGRG